MADITWAKYGSLTNRYSSADRDQITYLLGTAAQMLTERIMILMSFRQYLNLFYYLPLNVSSLLEDSNSGESRNS